MSHVLLLTGVPGVGKTTVVRRVAERLSAWRLGGFYTEEIRHPAGHRLGFRGLGFEGADEIISHVDLPGPPRVGKYGVDVAVIDALVAATLGGEGDAPEAYLIDEIGKMECCSSRFVAAIERLLGGATPVLAVVALRGGGLIAAVKARPDVELREVTRGNRDRLAAEAAAWLEARRG